MKSNTMKRSGENMSFFAVRKPNVMTFRCERSIGRYGNIQRVAQQQVVSDETLITELARRGYNLEGIPTAEIVKIAVFRG